MRVLQVCPYDLERTGGVQRHILDLSRALASAGHEVTIVAPEPPGSAGASTSALVSQTPTGVQIYRLGQSRGWQMSGTSFELTWASDEALRRFKDSSHHFAFDVAHFHTMHVPFMPMRLFRRLAPRVKRRVVTFHDTPPPTLFGQAGRHALSGISRYLSHRLDVIIPVSESVRSHIRPAPNCEVAVLPPCIDLRRYQNLRRDGPRGDVPIVLFVGRLEARKGVLLLIEAFDTVRRDHPGARLVICGGGPDQEAAEALVTARHLRDAVTLAGVCDEDQKLALYACADVACAPSPFGESFGLVLAEAMAAGLPVVAAANAGYQTLLTGEGRACLVAPGDPRALAEGLSRMLASPELRQKLSAWGRSHALQADVSARLPDFLKLYAQPA